MITTYLKYLQILESFASAHLQVQRFKHDFAEQFGNFSTEAESFPVLYVVPQPSIFGANSEYLNTYTVDVYCVDLLQKDRSNVATILNTTNLILND